MTPGQAILIFGAKKAAHGSQRFLARCSRQAVVAFAVVMLLLVATTSANAQTPAFPEGVLPVSDAGTAKGSLRAVLGLGLGNIGLAGVAAAEALYWPSRHFGIGADGSAIGQLTLLDDRTSALGFGPLFAIRWPVAHGVWELTSGAGLARLNHVYVDPCLLACVDALERRTSWGVQGTLGLKFMAASRDRALYGLGLRADVMGQPHGGYPEPEVVFTVNALIGTFFGAPTHPEGGTAPDGGRGPT